jgi:hypothetical protein
MPEHFEILGPNGSGKSLLERTVLQARLQLRRSRIVVLATKPDDSTIRGFGWPVIDRWPPPDERMRAMVFWARSKGLGEEGRDKQRAKVLQLLNGLWVPESNTVLSIDEVAYLVDELKLRNHIVTYHREGRALGITIVDNSQRGQGLPRAIHSEAGWTAVFKPKDHDDAERLAEILGNKKQFTPVLMGLNKAKYEFLLRRELTGESYVSWIDKPPTQRSDNR